MPLHDWTRVDDGIFHDFHLAWIAELRRVLNGGLLPPDYYALGEQVLGGGSPDVLALSLPPAVRPDRPDGNTAVLSPPPQTRLVARSARPSYTANQRRLVIRHKSGHPVVALVEVVSAGNKASEYAWDQFVDKAVAALHRGIHLLLLDAHPPTPRDPGGVHGAVWGALTGEDYTPPPDADRTMVAYSAGVEKTAYVEPLGVGRPLPDMPLFLTPDGDGCVRVPLEATYQAAFGPLARFYRDILEAPG